MYTAKLVVDGKTFEVSHASAFEALNGTATAYAQDRGMEFADAIDELAYMEQRNQLIDELRLDGELVNIADHI